MGAANESEFLDSRLGEPDVHRDSDTNSCNQVLLRFHSINFIDGLGHHQVNKKTKAVELTG